MIQVHEMDISSLKPWQDNPRLNDHAVDAVAKSIATFGFNVPILCDGNLGIVAGHTRWKAAQKLGLEKVPVIVLDMNDTQRRAFAIADNKTAEIADWNLPNLRNILNELRDEDVKLEHLGFSNEEIRKLTGVDGDDEDELPEPPVDPQTEPGDLWGLGEHRLLCGDSRDAGSANIVTSGQQIGHVFAGPPYFNQRAYSKWEEYSQYMVDMRKVALNCRNILKGGGVLVWNIGNGSAEGRDHSGHHSVLLEECGLRYIDTIAWVKSGANFSIPRNCHIRRNGLYYPAFQWEALLIYQKPGDMPKMSEEGVQYMSSYQTNVWEVPAVTRQLEQYGHSAVCPVEIPYRCLQAYTQPGETVLEPFGGSGTTLIAAETVGRRALLIEMSPSYCDIIIKRWETMTGHRAERMPTSVLGQDRHSRG